MKNKLKKPKDFIDFSKDYLKKLSEIMNSINLFDLKVLSESLIEAKNNKNKIFFIGNGGSASTASHMANDISIGSRVLDNPFKTYSLCDNISILTAVGNDFGYEKIFTKQLEILANKNDLLIAISASGNSKNLIKAINWGNENNLKTFALTSFETGGEISKLAKFKVHIPTKDFDYGPAEDIHLILNHILVSYFQETLTLDK